MEVEELETNPTYNHPTSHFQTSEISFFFFFFLCVCVCVVRFLDKSRLVAWIERENVFPSQLPKHNLQKETCQRKLTGLQMVTPRGWGGGSRRREGVGKSPNPSRIIYSYIHISFYSKEHRVACPFMRHFCKRRKFACDLRAKLYFMSRGGLHLPPKIPTCFH